jgi:ankyrin repeat protein
MSSVAINPDGTLKKFETPVPTGPSAMAAEGNMDYFMTEDGKANANVQDDSANTPLIWAADRGHAQLVQLLVDLDVDVNHKGFIGNTALARAARAGHVDVVSALLASPSIDANICNDKKQYPLHFAAFKKKHDVVRNMLSSGKCDTLVLDRKGRTPAEDTSDEDIKKWILEAQATQKATSKL